MEKEPQDTWCDRYTERTRLSYRQYRRHKAIATEIISCQAGQTDIDLQTPFGADLKNSSVAQRRMLPSMNAEAELDVVMHIGGMGLACTRQTINETQQVLSVPPIDAEI